MNREDKNKKLNEMFVTYPELSRVSDLSIPLCAISMLDDNIDYWFDELERILKERVEYTDKTKIINTRHLYCKIPIYISAKMYDRMKEVGISTVGYIRIPENGEWL